uniref:DUF4220 domain-containing protein n=1 Tax=Oryza glumipatula TaxID=40148 RepID=A0A0E0BBU5_9ORYZ
MKLLFVVVLMAIVGCTLYINGFVQVFFPWVRQIGFQKYSLSIIARFLLNFAFFQFVPLVSATISQSQPNSDGNNDGVLRNESELLEALLWLILVELIRKKVQGMLLPTDGSSFSRGIGRLTLMDVSYEVSHLVWVGYLIFANLARQTRRTEPLEFRYYLLGLTFIYIFTVLWSLCLAKLVLSLLNRRLASCSLHTARNPLVVAAYMQKLMEKQTATSPPATTLSTCKFVVMGEDRLVLHYNKVNNDDENNNNKRKRRMRRRDNGVLEPVTIHGYGYGVARRVGGDQNEHKHVHLLLTDPDEYLRLTEHDCVEKGRLITVEDVMNMHEQHANLFKGRRRQLLEDLCISFSLFKMFRRRFEHYPMVEVGSAMARGVMLDGVLKLEGCEPVGKAQKLCSKFTLNRVQGQIQRGFQVLQLELDLLVHYYQQAAAPVVMSQPILFVVNFVSSLFLLCLLLGTVVYILFIPSQGERVYCQIIGWTTTGNGPIPNVSFYITVLLVLTVIAIETHEFWIVHAFSSWNIVRMVCTYHRAAHRPWLRWLYFLVIRVRFLTFSVGKSEMVIYQMSIFDAASPLQKLYATVRAADVALPAIATGRIIDALRSDAVVSRTTGIVSLPDIDGLDFRTMTTTEIILACHLATELLDNEHDDHPPPAADDNDDDQQQQKKKKEKKEDDRKIASVLSRYCMFLVAQIPELLPDDETWVSDRYGDTASALHLASRRVVCPTSRRRKKAIAVAVRSSRWEELFDDDPAARRGARLFHRLRRRGPAFDKAWDELARFWVHLVVYLAPSNDVQGHAKALASWGSGDLLTCLWTLCTHAGITRQPSEQAAELTVDDSNV